MNLPILIKGPTGCGKTRFIEAMGERLGRKVYTVVCHDDLSAADLVGRHLIDEGGTFWQDGPLTKAVRDGGERNCLQKRQANKMEMQQMRLHP